jgi:hypothetical protein
MTTGDSYATLLAVPREPVGRLLAALAAAHLRPLICSLGIAALQPADDETGGGVVALLPDRQRIILQVTAGGGIAMLRTLEGAYEIAGGTAQLQAETLLRELRISLGQLPVQVREAVRRIRVFGRGEAGEELLEELQLRTSDWNVLPELVADAAAAALPVGGASDPPASPALYLAVRHLAGKQEPADFLPPRVSAWEQFTARYSTRKLIWAGVSAGAVAGVVVLAFLLQQIMLWRWESRWRAMESRVTVLDTLQQQIRSQRPWFEESHRSLSVLRRLTEAFPEDGAVFAKSVELRPPVTVVCSGTAQDRQALLTVLKKLSGAAEVADLKVERMDGTPLEFTFYFRWVEGGGL